MDDKKFEINLQELPCTGGFEKFTYPHRMLYKMQKYENMNFVLIVVKMCSNKPKRTTKVILIRIV